MIIIILILNKKTGKIKKIVPKLNGTTILMDKHTNLF
jgi:hypothetical protein